MSEQQPTAPGGQTDGSAPAAAADPASSGRWWRTLSWRSRVCVAAGAASVALLAGLGAYRLLQVALGDPGAAAVCILAVVAVAVWGVWRTFGDGVFSTARERARRAAPGKPRPKSSWSPWGWIILGGFLHAATAKPPNALRVNPADRGGAGVSVWKAPAPPGRAARARAYWRSVVEAPHAVRFQVPPEDERAGDRFADLTRRLTRLTTAARAAPASDVDPDLVALGRRLLDTDDKTVRFLNRLPALMKEYGVEWGDATAGEGVRQWDDTLSALAADPGLWDRLPPDVQRLMNEVAEVDNERAEELREIEIRQAVLRERYPGTDFPLPALTE